MEIITCNNNDFGTNSYVINKSGHSIVIDPNNYHEIITAIGDNVLDYIFLTHEHFDHIVAVDKLRKQFDAKLVAQNSTSENIQNPSKNLSRFVETIFDIKLNKLSTDPVEIVAQEADITYQDKYTLEWQGELFLFSHTPGHSQGSSCIEINDFLFCGDSLFEICETSFIGGQKSRRVYEEKTLPFFYSLEITTKVFPGHYESFVLEDKIYAKRRALEVYAQRPRFTNCYVDYDGFVALLEKSDYFVRGDNVFIIVKQSNFCKFFYFSSDLGCLERLDNFFNLYKMPLLLEIALKNDLDLNCYGFLGFCHYKTYSRYRSTKKNKFYDAVVHAEMGMVDEIKLLIDGTFDVLSDYLPSVNELMDLIAKKEVFVVKVGKCIAGVSIYEKKGKSYYFRLSCVHPDYRPGVIGYMLASSNPALECVTTAWVEDNNLEAKNLNEYMGYESDGLKNYVFLRELE